MPYIGKDPVIGEFIELDALTASATADYALTRNGAAYKPATVNNLLVSINGVIQAGSTMSLNGNTLTVGATLSSSDTIDFVRVLGSVGNVSEPTDGSVTSAKLASGAVTSAKLANDIAVNTLDVATIRASNGTTAATIDSSGIVKKPKVPAFAAKISSNWTTSGATVIFDTESYDNSNNYNTSTGVFTAPVDGMYSFTTGGARYYNDPTTDYILYLKKNGVSQMGFLNTHEQGRFSWTGGSYAMYLDSGDEVSVEWWAAGSGNKTLYASGSSSGYFTGYFIG